jgi:hypothetical protein
MDEVTQQNAALVEEASAASEAMREQASNLAALVGTFTVAQAGKAATRPLPAVPKAAPQGSRPALPGTPKEVPERRQARPRKVAVANGGEADWEEF